MRLPHSEAGEGAQAPVLLLHAGIADRRMWSEHLAPLAGAAGRRVVAVDLPGFGEAVPDSGPVAHWEDVLETMDALGVARASLVGNSFGAAVALRVAALNPERVASLALFSAPAVPEPDPSPDLLSIWDAEEEALGEEDLEKAVEVVLAGWVRPEAAVEVRERIAAMQLANYRLQAAGPQPDQAPDPLEDDPGLVGAIGCPVLLAAGESDVIDFKNAVGELAAAIGGSATKLISGCGHLAPLEAPEECRKLVLEHLNG